MTSTKQEVINYIQESTKMLDFNDFSECTAKSVSLQLSVSRSLASQYLNELYRENLLIKISSRPVLFLHKQTLKYEFGLSNARSEYLSTEELRKNLDSQAMGGNKCLVGVHSTFKSILKKGYASVSYPPYGLPLLLIGSKGSGKQYLNEHLFNYVVSSNNAYHDKYLMYEVIDNDTFYEDIVKLLLHDSSYGYLYISNIENLNVDNQYLLSKLIKSRTFVYKQTEYVFEKIVVIASNERKINPHLASVFAFSLEVPDFLSRNVEERKQLVIHFFKQESKILAKDILINESLMDKLINQTYQDDLDGLKQTIIKLCAIANIEQNSDQLIMREEANDSERLISIYDYVIYDGAKLSSLLEAIITQPNYESVEKFINYLLKIGFDSHSLKNTEQKLLAKTNYFNEHLKLLVRLMYLSDININEVKLLEKQYASKLESALAQECLLVSAANLEAYQLNFSNELSLIFKYIIVSYLNNGAYRCSVIDE